MFNRLPMSEGTQNSVSLQQIDAQKWGEDLLNSVRSLAAEKEIHLFSEIDSRIGKVAIENKRMTHLVRALLASAIITSPAGGSVGLELIADSSHDTVHLTIWDSGAGVQGIDILRLFSGEDMEDHYDRVLNALPDLVFKHEGLLTVNHSPGFGTRVTFSLPWKDPQRAAINSEPLANHGHILIVDDDELNIFTISRYLRSLGFEVTTAYNGWEGVEKMIRSKPDLILMDINMPIMNGIEAIRHIRSLSENDLASVPVLVLSAYSMSSDQNDCLAAGANEFISKPVSMRWLGRKLNQYLPTPGPGPVLA